MQIPNSAQIIIFLLLSALMIYASIRESNHLRMKVMEADDVNRGIRVAIAAGIKALFAILDVAGILLLALIVF